MKCQLSYQLVFFEYKNPSICTILHIWAHIVIISQHKRKKNCVNHNFIKNHMAMKQYIFFNYDIWQKIVNKMICLEDINMSL